MNATGDGGHGGDAIAKQCGGGFWGAVDAAVDSKPGKEPAGSTRKEDVGAVHGRVSAEHGEFNGTDGDDRRVQQSERGNLSAGCARIDDGSVSGRKRKSDDSWVGRKHEQRGITNWGADSSGEIGACEL